MNKLLPALALLLTLLSPACSLKPTTKHDVQAPQAQLPQEEAPHRRNSLEWWYFTGHLRDSLSGQQYGLEYVFFHFNPTGRKDHLMVNVALTDPQQKRFRYDYEWRGLKNELPSTLPLDLSLRKQDQTWTLRGQEGRYQLHADLTSHPGYGLSLRTEPAKPVLLHGGTGYENYGNIATAGYYSYPRLSTRGTLLINGEKRPVSGELWYDRQWNCGAVTRKDIGWDWFSIQLDEPREELMLYAVYDKNSTRKIGGGTHNSVQSQNTHLGESDFQLETLEYWTSPKSKLRYPSKWRVRVPSQGYDLVIEPVMPEQELTLKLIAGIRMYYWEGMCRVTGTRHGQPVRGNSYVEITNR
ncbi:lipocalin family protein [Hymenobacter sp. B81]|uniref:lipocalin family protein n=1 Tax=Hymenobacter sp. B81 TaxID=3344878 RepID=UPI0037DDDFF8